MSDQISIAEFYRSLQQIETLGDANGLAIKTFGYVNWFGSALEIEVEAHERGDGNWKGSKRFGAGSIEDVSACIGEAREWATNLPGPEDRAIELVVRRLNEFADSLPKGNNEIAAAAWAEIHQMLKAKAERIAKNGLPSPARIANFDDLRPREGSAA